MWLETPPGKIKNKNETLGEVLLQEIGMPSPELRGFEKIIKESYLLREIQTIL